MADLPLNRPPLLDVRNISLNFQQVQAVRNVSFRAQKQSIFGLVGSDGAGKSSVLRMIAGMIRPSSGAMDINGHDAAERRRELKHFIGYMPQRFGLYPDLTVEENMDFFMDVFSVPRAQRKKRKEKYLGFSNLLPFVDRLAGNLSGGMKQKLGLACVLVHEPGLLILDEPTNGVDPVSRREFWDILQSMKEAGMTLLVSTAYLDEGEKCDWLALMHAGVILEQNAPGVLRGDYPSLEEAIVARLREADQEIAHDTFAF
jgi:ABC-2 type transport system ATP-binding protein